MKNHGLICLWQDVDSDFLKYVITAFKNLEITAPWLIDILNDMPKPKFKNEMIVCEILYSPKSDEEPEYFYFQETEINPFSIIWDKSYHINLKEKGQ